DIESFIEENKAKVALALAGAAINTGVAIETSKDGVTAAGLPAAAAGIITILKYLASQLKPSTGLPDSSSDTLPEKTPPDNIDTRVPTESRFKPAHEIYEDFQKAIEKLVKDPVEALEEFSLKADAFKAVKSNIVFNPESHHVPEHVLKLVEQMESSNPVDLVTTAENTKFVFPDSIDSLAEYKNLPQEVIDGALMYRTDPRFGAASAGLTIPTTNNECYIIVPATRLQVISGKSIENGDVAAHLRHEMGHVLRSKLGWEENVQVRSRIYDGQRLLEKDLESVYQKIDSGQPLTDTENALSRLQNLTYNMRASLAEGQKLAQRQTGAEEVLCELYSIEYSPHPMNDAFTQQVLKYFGDALEPLRENNWNRPKDPTRVRRLFGVLDR
ncbi:MAG: hypothetical protein K8F91_09260, partial [Candidatus Obscuribacterales bacterium]|nr:hypothetical protein [Candidatus Obscuribacterales bacterium]